MRTFIGNHTAKIVIVTLNIVAIVLFLVFASSWYGFPFSQDPRPPFESQVEYAEDGFAYWDSSHPFLQALTNLPGNTSLQERSAQGITVKQRLADESFVTTELFWKEGRLFQGEQEILVAEVSDIPYTAMLLQNPEKRIIQFNRERTRQEILDNLRNRIVMPGLYLSSQSEVDNLVIETTLEGFTLISFYATEHWLYALFTNGQEDKLMWWDGSHLTLAGNFRR
jgi:hypothetical protein